MISRNKFDKETLIQVLEEISMSFKQEITGYLIGGLAMIYHDTKLVTKDIDLVFENDGQAKAFRDNMLQLGYEEVNLVSEEYERLKTFTIIEKPDGFRFDVFIRSVCDGLILSEEIKKRAEDIKLPGNFKLLMVSVEDIFLFKSITSREDDLDDMELLSRTRLDWDIIRKELSNQPNQWRWYTIFHQNLVALEEDHLVSSPLREEFEEKAEVSIAMGLVITKLENQSLTKEELLRSIDEEDPSFSNKVIDALIEQDLIVEKDGVFNIKTTTPQE